MSKRNKSDVSARKLGMLLVKTGVVEERDMRSILRDIEGLNADLPFILDKRGLVDEVTVAQTIASAFKLPFLSKTPAPLPWSNFHAISIEDMESCRILPLEYDRAGSVPRLKVMMSNPFNLINCKHLASCARLHIVIGISSAINHALQQSLIEQQESPFEAQVLDQLMSSGILTSAQLAFAKDAVYGRHRKPLSTSGSKSEMSSEFT